MSALSLLENVNFNPRDYNASEWFIEQDSFKLCTYDDKPIDIPVLVISSYTLAYYKYYISICCEKILDEFYECLGNQPLKLVFTHVIDDSYVKRHGFNVFPDTNLNRKYTIKKNELYLDSNEVELDTTGYQAIGDTKVLGVDEESSGDETENEDINIYLSDDENTSSDSEDNKEEEIEVEGLAEIKF